MSFSWVYPRACGGTVCRTLLGTRCWGLSPRLRGNAPVRRGGSPRYGSIPALAGERPGSRKIRPRHWVYPRACGGTSRIAENPPAPLGLSPRLRGNGLTNPQAAVARGSIPALAGERAAANEIWAKAGVYPRACGGTFGLAAQQRAVLGLSPRLRGNVPASVERPCPSGSIPALARERMRRQHSAVVSAVYPRACGGTGISCEYYHAGRGLSPRLRGNGSRCSGISCWPGSIPALARERNPRQTACSMSRVYPRACGGTNVPSGFCSGVLGLSPRLRGNGRCVPCRRWPARSIPALAGERRRRLRTPLPKWVYPRACGGTFS